MRPTARLSKNRPRPNRMVDGQGESGGHPLSICLSRKSRHRAARKESGSCAHFGKRSSRRAPSPGSRGTEALTEKTVSTATPYLLSNPIFIGKVRLKGELQEGEHPAIIDPKVWKRTSGLLASTEIKRAGAGTPQEAILRDLLFCEACQTPMVPTYTKRNNTKVRYYTCCAGAHARLEKLSREDATSRRDRGSRTGTAANRLGRIPCVGWLNESPMTV